MDKLKLNNGIEMPVLGFYMVNTGQWKSFID